MIVSVSPLKHDEHAVPISIFCSQTIANQRFRIFAIVYKSFILQQNLEFCDVIICSYVGKKKANVVVPQTTV